MKLIRLDKNDITSETRKILNTSRVEAKANVLISDLGTVYSGQISNFKAISDKLITKQKEDSASYIKENFIEYEELRDLEISSKLALSYSSELEDEFENVTKYIRLRQDQAVDAVSRATDALYSDSKAKVSGATDHPASTTSSRSGSIPIPFNRILSDRKQIGEDSLDRSLHGELSAPGYNAPGKGVTSRSGSIRGMGVGMDSGSLSPRMAATPTNGNLMDLSRGINHGANFGMVSMGGEEMRPAEALSARGNLNPNSTMNSAQNPYSRSLRHKASSLATHGMRALMGSKGSPTV